VQLAEFFPVLLHLRFFSVRQSVLCSVAGRAVILHPFDISLIKCTQTKQICDA
jgi:hypothetical protein